MANTENNAAQQDQLEIVESKFGQTEQYIEENRNKIFTVIAIIAAIILGYLAYQKYVKTPKENKAAAQMFQAENYFELDSFNLALNGDGNYPGFLKIMKINLNRNTRSVGRGSMRVLPLSNLLIFIMLSTRLRR